MTKKYIVGRSEHFQRFDYVAKFDGSLRSLIRSIPFLSKIDNITFTPYGNDYYYIGYLNPWSEERLTMVPGSYILAREDDRSLLQSVSSQATLRYVKSKDGLYKYAYWPHSVRHLDDFSFFPPLTINFLLYSLSGPIGDLYVKPEEEPQLQVYDLSDTFDAEAAKMP